MRGLVLGCGSIGRRHALNLRDLGIDVAVFDTDADRRAAMSTDAGVEVLSRDDAVADVVVVATPTGHHVEDLEWALERGAHVFVEKPLGASRADAERAVELGKRHSGQSVMIGCNLRFTQGYTLLRENLSRVGRPSVFLVDFGWWLPAWRPQQDYRLGYGIWRRMGGGIVLDAIHEIDYTIALAGPVESVMSLWTTTGVLEGDVEDVADLTLRHRSGAHSHIHLDYLRRTYSRSCTVIGSEGQLTWDFAQGRVEVIREAGAPPELLGADLDRDRNRQYVEEMHHFLQVIGDGRKPVNGVVEAAATLDVALTALETGNAR